MGTPTDVTVLHLPDQPSTALRDREEAEIYVAMVCFKHGPPRLHGVELEWTVHHRNDPSRPLDASLLRAALGPHAPQTINPHHDQLQLPAGSLITVEPGGQVEISTPPTRSVAGLIAVATADAATLADLLGECGLVLGDHGTDPHRPPNRLLQVPRYAAMQSVFDLIGPHGSRMMCSTASIQVCLDAGEADQIATRWQAAYALGPALVALFANSPNLNGRPTGWASSRLRATLSTCPPFTLPPEPSAVPASDGNLYGTAYEGGASNYGTVFKFTSSGTSGTLTVLHSFDLTDGSYPQGALVQATDGNLYGTTSQGGNVAPTAGTIFEITEGGKFSSLYSFDETTVPHPAGGLVQATNGSFYGTTASTVFNLSVGLPRFVKTEPTSGKVGAAVIILGTTLTGATKVEFNGTPATFTVVSSSEIETTVPAGATTGKVSVVTASGTLYSNTNFVVPQSALATSTALSSTPNPSNLGQSVTFTAKVTVTPPGTGTPTGTVTFLNGTTTLGSAALSSGEAVYATSGLSAGSHSMTAKYGGSTSFLGSTSPVLTQQVNTVTLSPTALNFGTQPVKTTTAAPTVTLTNNLSTAVTISGISFTGTDPGDFAQSNTCGSSVAAKGKCTISVKFTPQATGTRTATLNVKDSANNSPQTVSLTGTGELQVAWTPTSLTFAAQAVKTSSAAQTVTLTNDLSTALIISGISFTGTDPSDFAQTNTCGSSVAAKGKCTLSVKFTPQATGTRTATLNVKDTANNSPQTVKLTGTGE